MSNGLKFLGKDPQGNAKGINVDDGGRIKIASFYDVINESIPGEGSVESSSHTVYGSHITFVCQFGATPQREIDIHWLDSQGNDLAVDVNAITGSGFINKVIKAKSPHYKLTVRNMHTSSRDVKVLASSPLGIYVEEKRIESEDIVLNQEIQPEETFTTSLIKLESSKCVLLVRFSSTSGTFFEVSASYRPDDTSFLDTEVTKTYSGMIMESYEFWYNEITFSFTNRGSSAVTIDKAILTYIY